jgi:mRNA interferase MazF
LTTDNPPAPIFRLLIAPSEMNALIEPSYLMVDKITTIPKAKLRRRIGQLGNLEIVQLNRAIAVFLGVAASEGERGNA